VIRARGRRRSSKRDRVEVWRIILWSGLTNLVLLSVFLGAQRLDLDIFGAGSEKPTDVERWSISPAAETSTIGMKSKGDLSTPSMIVAKTEPDAEMPDEAAAEESAADLALAAGASVDDSETLRVAPILRKSPQDGKLEIGNFKSLSLVGSPGECLDFGDTLLRDAGVSNEKLDVVAAADEITIVRICAANGSIIITCRGGQIAVNPRKSRPDDQCARKG
jgi:hypothetical protein